MKLIYSVRFRTNDQHEALFKKTEPPFESVGIPSLNQLTDVQTAEVENSVILLTIAQKFATFFQELIRPNSVQKAQEVRCQYENMRLIYCRLPFTEERITDTELICSSTLIDNI